jgi:hypothetical protein
MGMFAVYLPQTEEKIRGQIKETITGIKAWFDANPKRKTCTTQLWNGHTIKIKRSDDVDAVVTAAAEKAIADNAAVRKDT